MEDKKVCTQCNTEKEFNEFNKRKASKDGLQNKCRACKKYYQLENRDYILSQQREHYRSNKEEKLLKCKEYYYENIEKINIRHKLYNESHKERIKETCKEYYLANRERKLQYVVEYQRNRKKNDPDFKLRCQLTTSNWIHLKRSLDKNKSSSSKIINLFEIQDYKCVYCKIDISKKYHIEHLIPLSKGGSNLITNLALACPNCNLSKGNKD